MKNRQTVLWHRLLCALLGAAVGIAVFLALYGTSTLNVANDGWILNGYDETDIQQHYAGWLLFRNSHWTFPLGMCDTLAAPDGTLISYTDSLPWVSIFFKLLRGLLPSTFQWFGWYTLFCFAMQGAAGALLCTRGKVLDSRLSLAFGSLGGLLFASQPTLWERAFRHVALASQYLFLFGLYFYLEYRTSLSAGKTPRWAWTVFPLLGFITVGIHPYFLPPVMICALLVAVDTGRLAHRPAAGVGLFGGSLLAALMGGLLTGALGGGVEVSRYGYGELSMNLNAILNPTSRGGYTWSRLLPQQFQYPEQYDGFNYLGLGVLALTAAALFYSLWRTTRDPKGAAGWWRRNLPLVLACAFLTLFAATNHLTLGSWQLNIPMPQVLTDLCGIFRSSGRMFYLAGACMLLFGVYTIRDACGTSGKGRALACLLLAGVAALQLWDLSLVAAQKREIFEQPVASTVVNAQQTQSIGSGHTQLLAASPLREDRTRRLAILAGKQGLSTNISIAVSGSYPQAEQSALAAGTLLDSGQYDPSAVYVTTDEAQYNRWQQTFAGDAAVSLFVTDSCYFLVPQPVA